MAILVISFVPIIIDIVPIVKAPAIIYVDDVPGFGPGNPMENYTKIQDAINASNDGDTVFVYNGLYYEDVVINKTLNLTGESRDNTIINATDIGIFTEYIDYINISGFTIENASVAAIRLRNLNYSLIKTNKIQHSNYGILCSNVNNSVIVDNFYYDINDYIAINLVESSKNIIENNTVTNSDTGISLDSISRNNTIINNNCSNNEHGLIIDTESSDNIILNNIFNNNNGIFMFHTGITLGTSGNDNIFINNTMISNKYGFFTNNVNGNILINSTIGNSIDYDVYIKSDVDLTLLNTTFNKSSVIFTSDTSTLTVQWYLHINVFDYLGNPVPNAKVKIEDNTNGTYNRTFITNANGQIKWLPITDYIEQDSDGDTIGEKTYYTPHKIIAWNDTLVGYAHPEPFMNESKSIDIILYNGTLVELEKMNWNLVSIPRVQSDTNLETVLQSIEGRYNAVQWYDASDSEDHWKHYHVSKPPYMNDLKELNHTMGFWLYITDPQGTTLVVFGDEPITEQHITIYPGWNLVGYPSKSNKLRDNALDNLNFGSDVDKVERYNTTTGRIEEVTGADYLVVGQAYWIHSKVEEVWNVPL